MRIFDGVRERIQTSVLEPFSHGSQPLADTLIYTGDPGLFGPSSVTWTVMGDMAAVIGGIRALLIQFAHPEVAAGMVDHSSYELDPLGRISRTTDYVAATSYGAMPEVERAVRAVRKAHRVVQGESHRAINYTADDADLSSWVHNSLSESFLTAIKRLVRAHSPVVRQTSLPESSSDWDRKSVLTWYQTRRLLSRHGSPTTPS